MILIPEKFLFSIQSKETAIKTTVAPGCMFKLMADNWQIIGQVFSDVCLLREIHGSERDRRSIIQASVFVSSFCNQILLFKVSHRILKHIWQKV